MSKYIDADKLIHDLEERIYAYSEGYAGGDNYRKDAIETLLKDVRYQCSLQQEQPELPKIADYYYHKGLYEGLSQGRADALKILEESMKRKADPVIVIKQQEQQEVDLEKVINKWLDGPSTDRRTIARHFYELGKNAKK